MHVAAQLDLVFSRSFSFVLYPLGAGKRYFHELNLELKKIMQQLKEIEKETNMSLTLRTWSWFSVVISVAMRFFRNATRGASNEKQAS